MKIEIWTDIICPWCGLGANRLAIALNAFPHADDIEVVHRSFQLDPTAPEGVAEPAVDMLRRRKGIDTRQFVATGEMIEQLAHDDGIADYHVADNNVGNTGLAHEFLAYASEQGKAAEAWDLMYAEYFGKRSPIWTIDDLLPLADQLGLDAQATATALSSRRYRNHVREDQLEAEALGANGVPFFVVDRRYGMSGAQPPAAILGMIQRAWDESEESAAS